MPETRAVRRLQHSAEAICPELPQPSSHQCYQSSTPYCGDGVFSDESVKMELVNIWNSKLQTQGECTSTRDGESKETKSFLLIIGDDLHTLLLKLYSVLLIFTYRG